ncbi:unnamed protein product [Haemonchus placei]|uniref:Reverse transcriptase domain-containing protein n=1 Tax=Haemonchus placei TaxID=6290 RepID=A0A0N4VU47_HAEPC|nr:unnamed protein product [Haemonchus placei]
MNLMYTSTGLLLRKQLRGLAMGQRLAPVSAIAFMSKTEKPSRKSELDRGPILYYRYIDTALSYEHCLVERIPVLLVNTTEVLLFTNSTGKNTI